MKIFKKDTFIEYHNKIKSQKTKLKIILKNFKKNKKKIVGFGAPAKLTTFSYVFEINRKIINFIIDDNPLKQNTFSPGKKIPIHNYEYLKKNEWDIIIIFAWNFSESILKKIKKDFEKKKNNNTISKT